jgi:serine/threonine protein phosphatase PrpC
MTWEFHLASDIGGRDEQQDRMGVFEMRDDAQLMVLADGMGGHDDGALAAQTVIDTAAAAAVDASGQAPQQFLAAVCHTAHAAIRRLGEARGSHPASTCVMLYLHADIAHWCHVGDSRLYHVNAEHAVPLTEDHSVQGLIDAGAAAAADLAAAGNGLYMCLGGRNPVSPEAAASCLAPGDAMLLCSDGFWQQLDAEEIRAMIASTRDPAGALHDLVETARVRGGKAGDNVSAALATQRVSRLRAAWRRLAGER